MNQPVVSIVVNNYNYEQFVSEAIDSALNQTYPHVEVIVVDDGSKDNSPEIIQKYGDRITAILKQNGGQGSAFNQGFKASHGDIIMFLDSDDYLYPQAAQQIVTNWKPDLANLEYRLNLIDGEGKFLDLYPARELHFDTGNVLPILLKTGRYSATVTSGNAFSRKFLEQVLPVPEVDFRISADGYLITLVPFYGAIAAIEEPLGAYRKHGKNLWALSSQKIPVASFRKAVAHDLLKYKVLASKAQELGHTIDHELGSRDYPHLISRIASCRLEPEHHPEPFDRGVDLAVKGYQAIWQYSEYPWKRKLIVSLWFLWVGLMPRPLAEPAIAWLVATNSRPKAIDWMIKKVRSLTQS